MGSSTLEVSSESNTKTAEHSKPQVVARQALERDPSPIVAKAKASPAYGSFQSSLLEYNHMKSGSRLLDTFISLAVNLALIAGPIFVGLYFTDTLNLKQFNTTFLAAPPPPPPPPPAAASAVVKRAPVRHVFENAGKLIAPTVVPRAVADIKEAPIAPDDFPGGMIGGVPGGVAGGSMGGVIGGVIGGANSAAMAPMAPKENKPRMPLRVGGHLKEPKLIARVEPAYPPLARQAHIQGTVLIDAVVDEQGNVVEMKVMSGHPLLIQAALDAVRRWRYQPTYLNEQAVAVQLNVTVVFQLRE